MSSSEDSGIRSAHTLAHLPGVTPTTKATLRVVAVACESGWGIATGYPCTVPDQTMKPATAAKKLGIFLPATPTEFQEGDVTRSQLLDLQATPPEWLVELRKNGPHPRQEVARKLGISTSGLARAGVADTMTSVEIKSLLEQQPEWLVVERATHAAVQDDNARIKADRSAKAAQRGTGSERSAGR